MFCFFFLMSSLLQSNLYLVQVWTLGPSWQVRIYGLEPVEGTGRDALQVQAIYMID